MLHRASDLKTAYFFQRSTSGLPRTKQYVLVGQPYHRTWLRSRWSSYVCTGTGISGVSRWAVGQHLAGTCLRKAPVGAAVTTAYHGIAVDMHVSPDIRLPVDNNNALRLVPANASGHDTDTNYTPSGNKHEK